MMKKNYTRHLLISIATITVLIAAAPAVSAQVSTLYHMETVSTRHELNPSFQPIPRGYYSTIPILSGISVSAGNNSLTFSDIILPQGSGGRSRTSLFYSSAAAIDNLYNNLRKTTHVYAEVDLRLFAFGIRINDSAYLTIGLNTKETANLFVPRDLFKFAAYGTADTVGVNSFNFDRLGIRSNVYTELAVGYSQKVLPKLIVGGKLKFLVGHSNLNAKIDRFRLNASRERWDFDIKGSLDMSIPGAEYELDDQGKIEKVNAKQIAARNVIGGFGVAVDLGANYKLFDDRLTVSASLLDLGFIAWKAKNASHTSFDGNYEFDGIDFEFKDGVAEWDEDYFDNIEENIEYKTVASKSYSSTLAAKVFLGAEYGLWDNKMSVGLLSKSTIVNKTVFEEITASANYIQFKNFNASLSYSLINGRFGTIGLGLGGRLGPVNLYLAGDYFPAKYTTQYIPHKNKAFNLQMGILFNFGYKKKLNVENKEL
jgi:hypothetical protein